MTWTPLDLARPTYHLRALARGTTPATPQRAASHHVAPGTPVPILTLAEAAQLLGLAGATSVHTQERRELGKGLEGSAPGSCTLATLQRTADAYGLELQVLVRPRR